MIILAALSDDDNYGGYYGYGSGAQFFSLGDFFASLLCYIIFILLPIAILAVIVHLVFSVPLRRRERARFFIDLLESALNSGQAVEHVILSAAETRDRAMGIRFYMLAAYIESGSKFVEALGKVPEFLPPSVSAMLRAGSKIGDLKSVFPACREILRDAPAAVRTAQHYIVCILLVFSPISVLLMWMMLVFVFPRFEDVAAGMNVSLWPVTEFVFRNTYWLFAFEVTLFLLLLAAAIIYMGGPQFVRRLQFLKFPIVDWISWHLPWKQKRLQRVFTAMLAVLLDGGMPEAEAIRLAGDCTANEICRQRTVRIIAALQQGMKLVDAIQVFDDAGEFHWRLANATHARRGFLDALRGWLEALDAKAFQQEEATAHVLTSGLVILNGVLVGLIATAVFGLLLAILRGALAL
jgi:type II secretory pathway component PulF